MSQIKPEVETFPKIKIIGVGGSGSNAVERMSLYKIKGVDFLVINTDAQDLHHTNINQKIHIGRNVTRGLGAGMNPELGRLSAEENSADIRNALKNYDMVFITCGLGGGTGTGAAPVIAEIAKQLGILTVAVVTKPFSFEGTQRSRIAEFGLDQLKEKVDTLVTIPNDRILNIIDKKTTLLKAFGIVDDVLSRAVQGISDLITLPGIINVDFADVKTIMSAAGPALISMGRASGSDRALVAAQAAINSPLLEISINGAKGVIFNISGGSDLSMLEINEAARVITESIDPEAKVIFGAVHDSRLKKGEIKITVIATNFDSNLKPAPLFSTPPLNPSLKKEDKKKNSRTEDQFKTLKESTEWEIPAFLRKKKK